MKTIKLKCRVDDDEVSKLVSWIVDKLINEQIEVSELVVNGTSYISMDQAEIDKRNAEWEKLVERTGYGQL